MTRPTLAAGIFAAGCGLRLRSAGPSKPMVRVAGRPLVHWVASGLAAAGAGELTALFNSSGAAARDYLAAAFPKVRWTFLAADTRSSYESFRLVCRDLARARDWFLVSTVDAIILPREVARFAAAAAADRKSDGALAVTGFVDDEKPLWADIGPGGLVTALGPDARRRHAATCGLYAVTRRLADDMPAAEAHDSLRSYWTSVVRDWRRVRAVRLAKTLDVDRPEDVAAAETFVKGLPEEVAP